MGDKNGTVLNRTVTNEPYRGLVESMSIPAELHERDGRRYATTGSVVPIHVCTEAEKREWAKKTHHYCGIFSEQTLAPLGELAYVRLDDHTAEKVFINRNKRMLVRSSDGQLAQWRCAPTFESLNELVAGAPLVDQGGALVSVVTARVGNHYAVSNFEGEGGYFDTPEPWTVVTTPAGHSVYGDRSFGSRELLRQYVGALPPARVSEAEPARPVLHVARRPRVALVAHNGRQIAHYYLHAVIVDDVQYL